MTDIVERLRYLIQPGNCDADLSIKASMEDAADEIERLRTTIEQLRSVAGAVSLESGLTFGAIKGEIRDGK